MIFQINIKNAKIIMFNKKSSDPKLKVVLACKPATNQQINKNKNNKKNNNKLIIPKSCILIMQQTKNKNQIINNQCP